MSKHGEMEKERKNEAWLKRNIRTHFRELLACGIRQRELAPMVALEQFPTYKAVATSGYFIVMPDEIPDEDAEGLRGEWECQYGPIGTGRTEELAWADLYWNTENRYYTDVSDLKLDDLDDDELEN